MIKSVVKKIPFAFTLSQKIHDLLRKDLLHKQLKIKRFGGGYCKLSKYVKGRENRMEIGHNCYLNGVKIRIVGNYNTIIFKNNCAVGQNCSFWMEGNHITIEIGASTTFTHTVHFCAQEDNSSIRIGEDCMFSNNIVVRTSDSHPIYDLNTRQRINPAKNVSIGRHVWIAPNTKIMKGAKIGNNAIIGSNAIITNEIPCNCLAVGAPGKIVKTDVDWTREKLF